MRLPESSHRPMVLKQAERLKTLMHSVIPQDPGNPMFRLGSTLGEVDKVWFRAKIFGQHRLFYRFDTASKIIVYVWVNDAESLRTYGSKNDAYAVFKKMLDSGYPPSTFEELVAQAREL